MMGDIKKKVIFRLSRSRSKTAMEEKTIEAVSCFFMTMVYTAYVTTIWNVGITLKRVQVITSLAVTK